MQVSSQKKERMSVALGLSSFLNWIAAPVCIIIGWEIGKFLYNKLLHKPIYRKRSIGVSIWMRGTKQSKQEAYEKFLQIHGPED